VLVIVEAVIQKKPKIFYHAVIGSLPVIFAIVILMILKTGTYETALAKDTELSLLLSPFYFVNSINIWGYAILLVPVTLLFKRTYADKFNYTFIAWFLISLLFWSANVANQQERFAIQFMPAVSYLVILAIENILKSNISIGRAGPPIKVPKGQSAAA
jgi:hypothetical protein